MNNELKIFENQDFGKVRVIDDNGKLFFFCRDVLEALKYTQTQIANLKTLLRDIPDEYKARYPMKFQVGGNKNVLFFSEVGLELFLRNSNKLNSKSYHKWITGIVEQMRLNHNHINKEDRTMDNELKIFENEDFGKVRVVMQDGEPWFVAGDVCKALDIEDTGKAINRLDQDEGTRIEIAHPQNPLKKLEVLAVNEPGLYSLVLGSRKSEAKKFKRWITHEVLPSIRKNGGYIDGQEQLTDSELMAKALLVAQNTIAEREKRIASMTAKIEAQNTAISVMQPKAEYCDKVLTADGTLITTVIAKEFGMTAKDLNKLLHQYHVQYKIGGIWVLYSEYQNKKYQKTETVITTTSKGEKARTWTRWTQEGRRFIHEVLKEHGILPLSMKDE